MRNMQLNLSISWDTKEKRGGYIFGCRFSKKIKDCLFAISSSVKESKIFSSMQKNK